MSYLDFLGKNKVYILAAAKNGLLRKEKWYPRRQKSLTFWGSAV
jgi:hypothetical protein